AVRTAGSRIARPALSTWVATSPVVQLPDPLPANTTLFGEPLLFKLASRALWGGTPGAHDLNAHPMAFGAWFGLLATALNLFPIGQLDGGHISYSVLGRKSSIVSLAGIAVGIVLSIIATSWIVWTVLMIVMLRVFGR